MLKSIELEIPKLHIAQAQVKAGAKRFNAVNCGRRWGKDVLAQELCVDTILSSGPIGWGSPTYKNLADDWRMLINILAPATSHKSEQEHRIELLTGGTLEMWSLDNADQIRGRKYKRFIFNEAASVPNLMDIWSLVVRPTLIDLHGDNWFFSTPKGKNGFYQLYCLGRDQKANPDWASFHFTSYDNPYLDPGELDALRATMTEEQYRQEILAEFTENVGQVFRNIAACMHAPITSPGDHRGHTFVMGGDWGKQNDFTALSVGCVECRQEVKLDRFNQIDYAFQRQRLAALYHLWSVKRFIGEQNSIGEPIIEELQRAGIIVIPFQTTNVSKMPLIEGLALEMEKASVQFQNDEIGKIEFEAFERKLTQTGLSTYSAPEGLHDDTVIARALMVKAMGETRVTKSTWQPPDYNASGVFKR